MTNEIEENFMAPNAVKKDVRKDMAKHLAKEVEHARQSVEEATLCVERAQRRYEQAVYTFNERLRKLTDYASSADETVKA